MDSAATIFMALGVLALPVAIVMFVISLIKKKSKKIPLIVFAVGIVMFIIGGLMMPSDPSDKVEEPEVTKNPVVQAIEKGILQYPASNDNFKYNIYDTYVEITEYIGDDNAKQVTVPATLENLPVYVVDAYVFDKSYVETIVFEEGIYDIKTGFSPRVKNVTLPSTLKWIGAYQFKNCYALENVVIPEGISSIQLGAFAHCSSLKEVTVPSSVTYLGKESFAYCLKLEKINLANGLKNIDESAFVMCENMESIIIPDTVDSIGFSAFQGTGLVSVEIPANVKTIGARAFLACESLEEVKFHNSDITIKPYDAGTYGTDTGLFGQCNEDLVVYGKPASAIANTCAKENIYFKAF